MKLYALIKVAGNPKVKRYWQMLKRLYGGTENTVKELSNRRNFGIYHGTRKPENIKGILEEGLKPSIINAHGTGVYLGSRDIAETYNKGGLVRLKYPQELSKKENYPKITSFLKHDNVKKNTFSKRKDPIKDYNLNKVYGIQKYNNNYNTNWIGQFFSRKLIKNNLLKEVKETPEEMAKWKEIAYNERNLNSSRSRRIGNPSDSSTWKSHYNNISEDYPILKKFNGQHKNKRGEPLKWYTGLPN